MKLRKTILIAIVPCLLFACTTFKPVEKMTDKELTDKYYATDLKLYMVKRGSNHSSNTEGPEGPAGKTVEYSKRDINKIKKLEEKLEIMKQELIKREYMP